MYTGRQVLERDSNWNRVQNTNLHLRICEIRQKLSQCPRGWSTRYVPMIVTSHAREEMGPFQLLSLPLLVDFWLSFSSIIQYMQLWHKIMMGIGADLPYLSWQVIFAIAMWVKFFRFKLSLKKCSNSMSPGVHVAIHFLTITSLQCYAHATAAQMSCYCGNHSDSKIKFPSNLNSVGKISSVPAVVDAIFSDAIKLTEREPPRERAPRWRHNKNCRPWLADEDQRRAAFWCFNFRQVLVV